MLNEQLNARVLFICGLGERRSPLARKILEDHYEADSMGLFDSGTHKINLETLEKKLKWSNYAFAMESIQVKYIEMYFPELSKKKRLRSLDIEFSHDELSLERMLRTKLNEFGFTT